MNMNERNTDSVAILEQAITRDRMPQAVLLYGESIQAIEHAALKLAAQILESEDKSIKSHPDLFYLRPSNKMRQINAENTRELTRNIYKTANRGGNKVALLYEADRMNETAANAFLKTLEEPPADTTILLLSQHHHHLLPTIQSRCMKFKVGAQGHRISEPQWIAWLKNYEHWLSMLIDEQAIRQQSDKLIIGIYAQICQFNLTLGDLTESGWRAHRETLPDGLPGDQLIALETSFRKGLRQQLWTEIQVQTRQFAVQQDIDRLSRKLIRVTEELEHACGLLNVNLQDAAALEYFFLKSLRIWAAR